MDDEAKKGYGGTAVSREKALIELMRGENLKARMQCTANNLFKIGSISQLKMEKKINGSKFSPTLSAKLEPTDKQLSSSSWRDSRRNMKCMGQDESFCFWLWISVRSLRNLNQNGVPYASYRLGPATCLFFPGCGMQSDFCYAPVVVVVNRLFFTSPAKFVCLRLSAKPVASKMQFRPKILSKPRSQRRRGHFPHDCISLHSVGHRYTTSSGAGIPLQLVHFPLQHERSAQNLSVSCNLERTLLVLYFFDIFLRLVTPRKCMMARDEFAVKRMKSMISKPEHLTVGDSMSEITLGPIPSTALYSKGTIGEQKGILRMSYRALWASAEVAMLDPSVRADQPYTGMFVPDIDNTRWLLHSPLNLRVFNMNRCNCYVTSRRVIYDDSVCDLYPEQSSFNRKDDLMSPALTYKRRPQNKYNFRSYFRSTSATYSVYWCGSASMTPTNLQRINFNNFNSFHEEPILFLNGCVLESDNKQRKNRVSNYARHQVMSSLYDNNVKEMRTDEDGPFEDIVQPTSESGSSGDESPHRFIMADCGHGQRSMPRCSVVDRMGNGNPDRIGTQGVGKVIYRSKRLRASSANERGRPLTSSQCRESNGRSSILRPSSYSVLRCENGISTSGEGTRLIDDLLSDLASDKNISLEGVCPIQNNPPPHYALTTLASRQMVLQRQIDHQIQLHRSAPLAHPNGISQLRGRSQLNVFDDALSSKARGRRYIRRTKAVKRPKPDCPSSDFIKQREVFQPDYKGYSPFHKNSFAWQWDSLSWPKNTPEYPRALGEPRSQRFLLTGESKKLQTLKSYPDGLPLRPVRGTKYLRIQSALAGGPHPPANSSWNKLGSDRTYRSRFSTSRIRSSSLHNPVSRPDGLFMSRYSLRSPIRPLLEQRPIQKDKYTLDEASSTAKGNKGIRSPVRQATPTELLKTTSAKQITKESEMKTVRSSCGLKGLHLTERGLSDNVQACFSPKDTQQCLWGSVQKKLGDVLHTENDSPDTSGLIQHSWSPEPTKDAFHIQPLHQQEHGSFLHLTRSSTPTCGDASDSPTQMLEKDFTDKDESKGTMKLLEELLTVPKSFTVGDSTNVNRKHVAYQARMPTNGPKVGEAIKYLAEQADRDHQTPRHGLQISYETDQTLIKEKLETVSPLGLTPRGTRAGCVRKIQPSTTRWYAVKLSITTTYQSRQQLRKYYRFSSHCALRDGGLFKMTRSRESSASPDRSGMKAADVRRQGELVTENDTDIITTRSDSAICANRKRSVSVVIRRTNDGNLSFNGEVLLGRKNDLQACLPAKTDSELTDYRTFTSTGAANSEVFISEYVDPEQTAAENRSVIEYVEPEPVSVEDIDLQSVVDTTQPSTEDAGSEQVCSDLPSRAEKVDPERTVHKYQSSAKNTDNGSSDGKQSPSKHIGSSIVIRKTKSMGHDDEGEDYSGVLGTQITSVQENHDFPEQPSGNSDKFYSAYERKISTSTSLPNSPVSQTLTPTVRYTKVTDEIPQIPTPCYHLLFKNAQIRSNVSSPLALITGLSGKPVNQIKGKVGKSAGKQRSEDIGSKSDKHADRFDVREQHHYSLNRDGPVEKSDSEEHKSASAHFPQEQLADKVSELELQSPPSGIFQSEKRLKSGISSNRQQTPEGSNMSDQAHGGSATAEQQELKEAQSSESAVHEMGVLKLDDYPLNEPQPGCRQELRVVELMNASHSSSSRLGCLEQSANDIFSGSQAELLKLEYEPEGGSGLQQMFLCTTSGPLFVGQQPEADETNLGANLHPLVTKTQKTACSTTSSISSSGKTYLQFQLGSLPLYENKIMREIERCWQYCGNNRGPIQNVRSFLRSLRSLFLLAGPHTSIYDTLRKLFSFYRTDIQSVLEGDLALITTNGEIYYQLTRQWAVAYLTEERRNSCSIFAEKTESHAGIKEELFGLYVIFLLAERLSSKASELLQENEVSLQDSDDTDQASKIFQKYIWSASQLVRYQTKAKDDPTILKDELCFVPPAKYPLPSLYQHIVEFLFTLSGNEELQPDKTYAASTDSRVLGSVFPAKLSSQISGGIVRAANSEDLRKKQSPPYSLCSSPLKLSEHTRWTRPSNLLDEACSASEGKTESAVHSISYSSEYLGNSESVKPDVFLLIDPPNGSCRFLQKTTPLKPVECLGYGRDKIVQEGGMVLKLSVINPDVVSSHEQLTKTVVTDQKTYTNDTIVHYSSKNVQSIKKVSEPELPHFRRPTLASSVATVSIPNPPSFVIKFQRDSAHREARIDKGYDHVEVKLLNQESPLNGYQRPAKNIDTSGRLADWSYREMPKDPVPHGHLASPVYRQVNKTNESGGTILRRNILARAPAKKSHPSSDQTSNRKISRTHPVSHGRGFISSNDNNVFHDGEIKSQNEQSRNHLTKDDSIHIHKQMFQKIHPEDEQQQYHRSSSICRILRTSSQIIGLREPYSLNDLSSAWSAEQNLSQKRAASLFLSKLTSTLCFDTLSGVQEEHGGKTKRNAFGHPTHPTEKGIIGIFARRFARVLKPPSNESFHSPSLYDRMSRKRNRPTISSSSVGMNMTNSFTENNCSSSSLLKNTTQQPEHHILNALICRIKEVFSNKWNVLFTNSDIQDLKPGKCRRKLRMDKKYETKCLPADKSKLQGNRTPRLLNHRTADEYHTQLATIRNQEPLELLSSYHVKRSTDLCQLEKWINLSDSPTYWNSTALYDPTCRPDNNEDWAHYATSKLYRDSVKQTSQIMRSAFILRTAFTGLSNFNGHSNGRLLVEYLKYQSTENHSNIREEQGDRTNHVSKFQRGRENKQGSPSRIGLISKMFSIYAVRRSWFTVPFTILDFVKRLESCSYSIIGKFAYGDNQRYTLSSTQSFVCDNGTNRMRGLLFSGLPISASAVITNQDIRLSPLFARDTLGFQVSKLVETFAHEPSTILYAGVTPISGSSNNLENSVFSSGEPANRTFTRSFVSEGEPDGFNSAEGQNQSNAQGHNTVIRENHMDVKKHRRRLLALLSRSQNDLANSFIRELWMIRSQILVHDIEEPLVKDLLSKPNLLSSMIEASKFAVSIQNLPKHPTKHFGKMEGRFQPTCSRHLTRSGSDLTPLRSEYHSDASRVKNVRFCHFSSIINRYELFGLNYKFKRKEEENEKKMGGKHGNNLKGNVKLVDNLPARDICRRNSLPTRLPSMFSPECYGKWDGQFDRTFARRWKGTEHRGKSKKSKFTKKPSSRCKNRRFFCSNKLAPERTRLKALGLRPGASKVDSPLVRCWSTIGVIPTCSDSEPSFVTSFQLGEPLSERLKPVTTQPPVFWKFTSHTSKKKADSLRGCRQTLSANERGGVSQEDLNEVICINTKSIQPASSLPLWNVEDFRTCRGIDLLNKTMKVVSPEESKPAVLKERKSNDELIQKASKDAVINLQIDTEPDICGGSPHGTSTVTEKVESLSLSPVDLSAPRINRKRPVMIVNMLGLIEDIEHRTKRSHPRPGSFGKGDMESEIAKECKRAASDSLFSRKAGKLKPARSSSRNPTKFRRTKSKCTSSSTRESSRLGSVKSTSVRRRGPDLRVTKSTKRSKHFTGKQNGTRKLRPRQKLVKPKSQKKFGKTSISRFNGSAASVPVRRRYGSLTSSGVRSLTVNDSPSHPTNPQGHENSTGFIEWNFTSQPSPLTAMGTAINVTDTPTVTVTTVSHKRIGSKRPSTATPPSSIQKHKALSAIKKLSAEEISESTRAPDITEASGKTTETPKLTVFNYLGGNYVLKDVGAEAKMAVPIRHMIENTLRKKFVRVDQETFSTKSDRSLIYSYRPSGKSVKTRIMCDSFCSTSSSARNYASRSPKRSSFSASMTESKVSSSSKSLAKSGTRKHRRGRRLTRSERIISFTRSSKVNGTVLHKVEGSEKFTEQDIVRLWSSTDVKDTMGDLIPDKNRTQNTEWITDLEFSSHTAKSLLTIPPPQRGQRLEADKLKGLKGDFVECKNVATTRVKEADAGEDGIQFTEKIPSAKNMASIPINATDSQLSPEDEISERQLQLSLLKTGEDSYAKISGPGEFPESVVKSEGKQDCKKKEKASGMEESTRKFIVSEDRSFSASKAGEKIKKSKLTSHTHNHKKARGLRKHIKKLLRLASAKVGKESHVRVTGPTETCESVIVEEGRMAKEESASIKIPINSDATILRAGTTTAVSKSKKDRKIKSDFNFQLVGRKTKVVRSFDKLRWSNLGGRLNVAKVKYIRADGKQRLAINAGECKEMSDPTNSIISPPPSPASDTDNQDIMQIQRPEIACSAGQGQRETIRIKSTGSLVHNSSGSTGIYSTLQTQDEDTALESLEGGSSVVKTAVGVRSRSEPSPVYFVHACKIQSLSPISNEGDDLSDVLEAVHLKAPISSRKFLSGTVLFRPDSSAKSEADLKFEDGVSPGWGPSEKISRFLKSRLTSLVHLHRAKNTSKESAEKSNSKLLVISQSQANTEKPSVGHSLSGENPEQPCISTPLTPHSSQQSGDILPFLKASSSFSSFSRSTANIIVSVDSKNTTEGEFADNALCDGNYCLPPH
ncbi:unnamed protein product [Calicophoron daubneyi]|uniref:Uncharacterized protein n=1 Tax=Calicophoron daubneyi TaxID=300641 RepID=A0AAV2T4J4_CALDB